MALPQEDLKPTSAQEFLDNSEFMLKVDDRLTVKVGYPDLFAAMAEGKLSMELMNAADKFIRDGGIPDLKEGEDPIKRLEQLITPEFKAFLQSYAVSFVLEPRIMWERDIQYRGQAIPVERLTTQQLMTIWNAEPPKDRKAPVVADPIEFRQPSETVPDSALPVGKTIRAGTIIVDPASEFKYQ
jgi:hypothetical protein